MSLGLLEKPMSEEQVSYTVVKVDSRVVRDAKIVTTITGEELQAYLSRVLAPIVARDKAEAMRAEPIDETPITPAQPKPRKRPKA